MYVEQRKLQLKLRRKLREHPFYHNVARFMRSTKCSPAKKLLNSTLVIMLKITEVATFLFSVDIFKGFFFKDIMKEL